MGTKVTVQLNFFGAPLEEEQLEKLLDPANKDLQIQHLKGVLEMFFDLPISALSPAILSRYREATTTDTFLSIVPHTEIIFDRLLKPLKSAKKNYALGDYLATIALCGIVGEMMAILVWKMNDVGIKGKPLTVDEEKGLLGNTFEKLGQERKIEVLKTFKYLTKEQQSSFTLLRTTRKPYLHLWESKAKAEKTDALKAYEAAFKLFKEITGIGLANSTSVKINPLLIKFFPQEEAGELSKAIK